MVYAAPSSTATEVVQPAQPKTHRRTRSFSFSQQDAPPNASFTSVAPSLPRRRSQRKAFYLEDDGGSSPEPVDENGPDGSPLSPLIINTDVPNFPALPGQAPPHQAVPFPSTGPMSPDVPEPGPFSPRPPMSRTTSGTSIVLSNGKPLKPSLKSASAPHLPDELQRHLRARSEPPTPSAKSVHFREEDDLEEVRVYNRAGRPANLLWKDAAETETETEAENAFPFPRTPRTLPTGVPAAANSQALAFDMDSAPRSSAVPRPSPDMYANVHLESLSLPKTRPAAIRGAVLVRNLSFQKDVAVRFTFDDWQTTSEIHCKHVVSLPGLPPPFPRPNTVGDAVGLLASAGSENAAPTWDRFSFQISLEDYVSKLADRTLFLVVRYTAPGQGEWWDNNVGQNYCVRFKPSPVPAPAQAERAASPVVQQKSFAPPSTVRLTPHSSSAPDPSPVVAPAPVHPKVTSAQAYAASIMKGRPVFGSPAASPMGSPRGSPHGSPRGSPRSESPRISPDGSPTSSDTDNRKRQTRTKPSQGLGLGLGLGLNPGAPDTPAKLPVRPPPMARSMSSPPVYSPSTGSETAGSFFASAYSGPTPSSRETDPLMARLSKLGMRNYASPGRSRASSVNENDKPGESSRSAQAVPSPSVPEEEDIVQQAANEQTPTDTSPADSQLKAPSFTPASSSEHSPNAGSTSSSATSSPLPGTPRVLSLDNFDSLPKLSDMWPAATTSPAASTHSGSESDASRSSTATIRKTADLVLNMPTPTNRGAVNSPFSPIGTPRFHIGSVGILGQASGARMSPVQERVGTSDANYAAFVRQFCFARSPSPTHGTPLGEGIPIDPTPVAAATASLPGPLQPTPATPQQAQMSAVTVQVRVQPRGTAAGDDGLSRVSPRSSPHGSAHGSPSAYPPSAERQGWLGMGDGYGFNLGMGMQTGKA